MELVEAGRAMRSARLVVAREGNLSVRIGPDRVLVTPAGVDKGRLAPADLVIVDLEGTTHGPGRPSSETGMHLEIYRQRPDLGAVAHGHPVHATAHAVAHRPLPADLLPEVIVELGAIPLSDYGTPSTQEIRAVVARVCVHHDAFLLCNHGAVAAGADPREAVERLETVERLAEINWLAAALGGPRPLDPERIGQLLALRAGPHPAGD